MENQTDQPRGFFPSIDKPQVNERVTEVDLSPYGYECVARLINRMTFSDYFQDDDDKFPRLAKHYANMYGENVSELAVRLSNQMQRMWDAPTKENGKTPNQDDFVKMSVENPMAFAALVRGMGADMNDQSKQVVELAKESFTDAVADTSESLPLA
jgi:hypothetical protein